MTANFLGAPVSRMTFIAGGAISANQLVKLNGTTENSVVKTTAITDDVLGVALQTVASGERVEVECGNGAFVRVIVSAAGSINANAEVMPDGTTNGAVAVAAGATAKSCGFLINAGGAGETVTMLLRLSAKGPANS